ncbi:UxaA family hydrolase [Variovorax sp. J31P207]|uniref:UxaA family hydrolase n=1 Tax=Variovorax sp. J31P207 TaxID=3053510 RepID=UPI00257621E2|nr:UxaA family hydrolase [Variovorax sp. J31P207]MDM0071557.1 UxaA family hydrolase [Variovorax sp. J31P207]
MSHQSSSPAPLIFLHPDDSVAIARVALPEGAAVVAGVTTRQPIAAGHKVATRDHALGAEVRRYGQIIGFSSRAIVAGEHVHEHNITVGDFAKDYAFSEETVITKYVDQPATFMGIRRADRGVGTRNFIGILTTVNCSAHVANLVARAFERNPLTDHDPLAEYPNVDGVLAFDSQDGLRHEFRRAADDLAPHAGGLRPPPQFFEGVRYRPGLRGESG